MCAVAAKLGVKHSSLYRHIESREELVSLAIDTLASQTSWPQPDSCWRVYLEQLTDEMWRLYTEFPGLATELQRLPGPLNSVVRIFAAATEALMGFGFADEEAVLIIDTASDLTIDSYLTSYRLRQHAAQNTVPPARLAAEALLAGSIPELKHRLPVADIARLETVLVRAFDLDGSDWWRRKRKLLLDGIAVSVQESRKTGPAVGRLGSTPSPED
ncbi:hypothetical protein ODZ83_07770 [Acaricomes phytoseiuli]|uniref:hypothetical protein n=1 Tax=Acaricomes phytoseiuli TaxID=291968 RepID=UPI0003820E7C|nr:hypothetical protein [Acaricomes phytoseiuli]MCW1250079.1 hypothetical protein [Acaricomes phytoseiuli]